MLYGVIKINHLIMYRDRTAETNLTIEVENLNVLNTVVKALRKIDSVYEVNRKK